MKTNFLRKLWPLLILPCCFILLQSSQVMDDPDPIQIEIQVSPNVLNLNSQSELVTVHTDIAYGLVLGASVTLNEVEIDWWKSDDRGNFVAKFMSGDVKGLPLNIGGLNTLTLKGITIYGDTFTGSYDVKVIQVFPKK